MSRNLRRVLAHLTPACLVAAALGTGPSRADHVTDPRTTRLVAPSADWPLTVASPGFRAYPGTRESFEVRFADGRDATPTVSPSTLLAEFARSGTIAPPAGPSTPALLGDIGGITESRRVPPVGRAAVKYTYAPLPEPASLALLGAGGAACLGLWMRRRMSRARG